MKRETGDNAKTVPFQGDGKTLSTCSISLYKVFDLHGIFWFLFFFNTDIEDDRNTYVP